MELSKNTSRIKSKKKNINPYAMNYIPVNDERKNGREAKCFTAHLLGRIIF